MNEFIFYFNFTFDNEEIIERVDFDEDEDCITFAFIVTTKKNIDINDLVVDDDYLDAFDEIEGDYGVHDWSTNPSKEIQSIGYSTYEIKTDVASEMIEKWRDFFKLKFGEKSVSEKIEFLNLEYKNDFDIYLNTKALIEKNTLTKNIQSTDKETNNINKI